ncbi:MAG: transglutaminase domain-containing protein [Ruminococcus sp.]|nr:transglutaminase domain-containing protein [Ruminococcus sp.]
MKKAKAAIIALSAALAMSVGYNVYSLCFMERQRSYLQSPEEIYCMECGVIEANSAIRSGGTVDIKYDFNAPEYARLREDYNLEAIAGEGSGFDRAVRLMDEFSGRLRHNGTFSAERENFNALYLLNYSLDQKRNGINCRAKAQILNEMCLALGIYSRKLWLMPISVYDSDCHVVNEVWDSERGAWIMLDITNDMYWVDENGTPLSALGIREKLSKQEFCTPVTPDDDLSDLEKSRDENCTELLYIAKNMVYLRYMDSYTVGESVVYDLMPVNLDKPYDFLISEESVTKAPN